jgi:tRNA(fMet)-specific endonuclease VapC
VVLGELHFGFLHGDRRSANEAYLLRFLNTPGVAVSEIGQETALCYAEIRSSLREGGIPIPANDIWIAAGAMELGLRVITTDAHFRRIRQVIVDYYPVA